LAETHARKFEISTLYTTQYIWFYMFVLKLVKTGNDFKGIQYSDK